MIQVNELRIGNWAKWGDTFYRIEEVINGNYDYLHPIPLTPDILEKCGFVAKENNWFCKQYFTDCKEATEMMVIGINLKSGRCYIADVDEFSPAMIAYRIQYLHQLQNLFFALTGEELEVNL